MLVSQHVCDVFVVFTGSSLGLSMHVFGTETHMTAIVGMALGKRELPKEIGFDSNAAANMFFTAQDKVRMTCIICLVCSVYCYSHRSAVAKCVRHQLT